MSLRAAAKTLAVEALCRTRADRLWSAPGTRAPLVLGYHQVVEDLRDAPSSIPASVVTTAMLERQLDWVGLRYRFVSLDELGRAIEGGSGAGRPPAAVTFDDGYRDVYAHAFPLLQRKGIPAAVFVVTDLVGTGRLLRHDRLHVLLSRTVAAPSRPVAAMRDLLERGRSAELDRWIEARENAGRGVREPIRGLGLLDWDEVRAMHRAGFAIGSHTASHALLTREAPDRLRWELRASRERLARELGAPVDHFAYPDGRFDRTVVAAVAEAGYRFAYGTCPHQDSRRPALTVPRRLLWENSCRGADGSFSPRVMQGVVAGVFDLFGRCRQDHVQPGS